MKPSKDISFSQALNSLLVLRVFYALNILLIVKTSLDFGFMLHPEPKVMTDFDAFHLTGQMYWQGKIVEAYSFTTMVEAQQAYRSTTSFMPWTYPPQFNFVTATLALLPPGWAYLLFATMTLALYTLVLRHLAGPWFGICAIMIFPAIYLNLRSGQNGFLTGALIGFFVIGFLARRSWTGLPAGLLIIKPHLAVGLALLTLIRRDWRTVILAFVVIVASSLAVIPVFGEEIWTAFLGAVAEAKIFLIHGFYPFNRMVSIYAAAHTFGAPASIASGLQIIAATAIISLIVVSALLRWAPQRHLLALAVIAPLYISPYLYDYDLTFLGVSLALVMPDLMRHGTAREIVLLLSLSWISSGYGLVTSFLSETFLSENNFNPAEDGLVSVSTFGLTAMLVLVIGILRRSYRTEAAAPGASPGYNKARLQKIS